MIFNTPGTFNKILPFLFGLCWLLYSPFLQAQTADILTLSDTSTGSEINDFQDSLSLAAIPSPYPVIDEVITRSEKCTQQNGSIQVIGSGGTGNLQFSIDGISFHSTNSFDGLAGGLYTIYVMDETESTTMSTALVDSEKGLSLSSLYATSAECADHNGTINLDVTGGIEPYFYSLNNRPSTLTSQFKHLSPGNYTLRIEDAQGCSIDTSVTIEHLPCPLYIPNVFSPNGDGVNDLFQIRVNDDQNITITRFFIFDRFGKKVYERYDLPAQSNVGWWDGTFKHFTVSAGVYYYFLEVKYENGDKETFKGDLTLIR